LLGGAPALAQTPAKADDRPLCSESNTVTANIAAFNEPLIYNRMGAGQSSGMIFALQSDVVPNTFASNPPKSASEMPTPDKLVPGQVTLRSGKRPRPIVLRVNQGQCLRVEFTNLLSKPAGSPAPTGYSAGVTVLGLNPVPAAGEDAQLCKYSPLGQAVPAGAVVAPLLCNGADAGVSQGTLIPPAAAAQRKNKRYYNIAYTYYAANEGSFLLFSSGQIAKVGATQLSLGLFGSVNVQPASSEWYRSQLSEADFSQGAVIQQSPKPYVKVDYDAAYAQDFQRPDKTWVKAGTPVYKMVHNGLLIATDINAVVTGPKHGPIPLAAGKPADFCTNSKLWNPAYPNPCEPYREFTVIYHEDLRAQQAFNVAGGKTYNAPYSDGADKFAINYGIGGITSEILANRLPLSDLQASGPNPKSDPQRGSGPSAQCTECKFEEFFLSSWAGGDPAMLVDQPLNMASAASPAATKALYPDDPSNVHHSYLGDHVRFRVLHAGQIHHIHHLHAHQWLFSQESSDSAYLDSQAIGPGSAYTQDIAYGGGGNRNRTPGDSIFHCHFYPHFASGMWELWRVHDVFEAGSKINPDGTIASGARALPDGEIQVGTPIPALMPLPTLVEAPLPAPACVVNGQISGTGCKTTASATDNPGYPFFIPGSAGHRPPHPPMDFASITRDGKTQVLNGGLPRHVVETSDSNKVKTPGGGFTNKDFSKELLSLAAKELPEEGTPVERKAIAYHQKGAHESLTPEGKPGTFRTNGQGPKQGAPFADPCGKDFGWTGRTRTYKAAALQVDAVLTKKGWHYPQQRMLSLWSDVREYFKTKDTKPPEPLFIRANSGECVEYWHTNLVPNVFELDDFEVRTPTDILGQHIHLVKFDVLASDGAANGWNYEDGTFSPDEVVERIEAINKAGGLASYDGKGAKQQLHPVAPPKDIFGEAPPGQKWLGAQTTVQRWLADPVMNDKGVDRTLRTVFTHDHYGPSTHQQAGLYAGLLVEPANSMWLDPVSGAKLGSRDDGSPTSFQASIVVDPAAPKGPSFKSYREFAMMFQDEQLAYQQGSPKQPDRDNLSTIGWSDPTNALNANSYESGVPVAQLPQPNLVTNGGIGVTSINYRAEPLPFRVKACDAGMDPQAQDSSHVFRSIKRCDEDLNKQPAIYRPLTKGMEGTDPYTPLLRTYQGDNVQVRLLVGAHINTHSFSINGVNWLFEPSDTNSGYRGAQSMGLSEHFELMFQVPKTGSPNKIADYLYKADNSDPYLTTGIWGLLRGYGELQRENGKLTLQPLPDNKNPAYGGIVQMCQDPKRLKKFNVVASTSQQVLKSRGGNLVLWPREASSAGTQAKPQVIQNALMYVLAEDLDGNGQLKEGMKVEPLVLRANAGDCVEVTLTNKINPDFKTDPAYKAFQTSFNYWGAIADQVTLAGNTAPPGYYLPDMTLSADVGLHPQLVAYDVTSSDGDNVGKNPVQTASPGPSTVASSSTAAGTPVRPASLKQADAGASQRKYLWYMGRIENGKPQPVEFGAINLSPSDPLGQPALGLSAALVVEPEDTLKVYEDVNTRTSATIELKDGRRFREFVTIFQGSLQYNQDTLPTSAQPGSTVPGGQALNYGTEPFSVRYENYSTSSTDISCGPSDRLQLAGVSVGDPSTPVFTAPAGMEVRFRMLTAGPGMPNGPSVVTVANHAWQYEPYQKNSTVIGSNPQSHWTGSQMGHQPGNHFDAVIPAAGGKFGVPGDYLLANFNMNSLGGGSWALLRVGNGDDTVAITNVVQNASKVLVQGRNGVQARGPNTGKFAPAVSVYGTADCGGAPLGKANVGKDGSWAVTLAQMPSALCARSDAGGSVMSEPGSSSSWAFNVPSSCTPGTAQPTSLVAKLGSPAPTPAPGLAARVVVPALTPAQLEEERKIEDEFLRKSGRPPLRRKK
jgi:hypothetical protein